MFCEKCGGEVPDNAKFCSNCGSPVKKINDVTEKKSMFFALSLSIFVAGLGASYAGAKKNGIIFFWAILLFNYCRRVSLIFKVISILIWVYAIYVTYRDVKKANGVENPDFLEDLIDFSHSDSFRPLVVVAILMVLFVCFIRLVFYQSLF